VILHEFGQSLVALAELEFEALDGQCGLADSRGAGQFGEGGGAVLKGFFLSAVEQGGVDLVLIAERGDRDGL
jgi:hypothetical protein